MSFFLVNCVLSLDGGVLPLPVDNVENAAGEGGNPLTVKCNICNLAERGFHPIRFLDHGRITKFRCAGQGKIQKNVKDLLCFSVNDRLSATLIQFFNFLLKKWLTRGKRRDTITTSLHSCGCIACRCKL